MATTRAELITTLEQTVPHLTRLTAGLADEALDFHVGPAEWSIREILAHLVDDEMYVMRLRMERIIKEDNPHLTPHDEQAWYTNRNTTRDQLDELLADFGLQRAASLGILKMLRESDWARPGYQSEYGAFTAEGWLSNWVEHDTVHLRQIESTLQTYKAQTSTS
ncbi:MAG TPA: DinB family protein [Ktedonobacterales bacterium]|nr:DinB family protein [Ktedonobacterales bacterium]